MQQIIKERGGTRMFERVSRWNVVDYTIISNRNRFAQYADNAGTGTDKLTLTFFKLRNHTYPLNRFAKLVDKIQLEDLSVLSRQDTETGIFYIEVSPEKDKVRLYKEIT